MVLADNDQASWSDRTNLVKAVKESADVPTLDMVTTGTTAAAVVMAMSATASGNDTLPMKSMNIFTTMFGGISYLFNTASVNKQFDEAKHQFKLATLRDEMATLRDEMATLEMQMLSLGMKMLSLQQQQSLQQMNQSIQKLRGLQWTQGEQEIDKDLFKHSQAMRNVERKMELLKRMITLTNELYTEEEKVDQTPQVQTRVNSLKARIRDMHAQEYMPLD
jgi:hypothetical protein